MTKKSKFQKALKIQKALESNVDPKSFFDDFKAFINRGNVVELAVGVIIGGAFSKIVSSLVSDIITPILGILLGGVNFSSLKITVHNFFGANTSYSISYGLFLQNVIDFIIIAFSIFIFVRYFTKLQEATARKSAIKANKDSDEQSDSAKDSDDTMSESSAELALLTEIRDSLKTIAKISKKH